MPSRSSLGSRRAWWVILAVGSVWALVVLGLFVVEWVSLRAGRDQALMGTGDAEPLLPFAMPGIVRPSTVDANDSTLRVDEEILGFEVNGQARAYRLGAFRDRSHHVVNDLIGEVAVTVAYCDLNDCARGYTRPGALEPLDVSVGGLYQAREMVLEVSGVRYFQDSGDLLVPGTGSVKIPLESLKPTRTTWGEWKRLHPLTDVYEGHR